MKNLGQVRFWLETILAAVTGILFLLTLISREWIEILFGVEPDAGNGSLEWLIVAALLALTLTLAVLARFEWRRLQTAKQRG